MVEKWYACPDEKCQWVPKNRDEQSIICPKCGKHCVQVDYVDKKDIQAWHDDLNRDNKGFRQIN